MCGIAGAFSYQDSAPPVDREQLLRTREAMVSRGPDGDGLWVSEDCRVGLAHRRLAIIDLSERGAQPMASADGRLRVTFNGEIYNYRELRAELENRGCHFHSDSDTEVLLHLYAERGAEMVHALRGMFAFAIWDSREQSLFLARDHFGIKPLYVADDGRTLRFASQVKALLRGGADTAPEPAGSVGFLIWGFVPEPYTLYRGIRSLPAGSTMVVARSRRPVTRSYFDVSDELRRAEAAGMSQVSDARERIREAAKASVRAHLVADVPVGIFLSAGIDSSTITGLASQHGGSPLHAVTLGFSEFQGTPDDEVPIASEVARGFGIRHDVHRITGDDFREELPRILDAMDQPSMDGVNTYFVSRAAARSGLKVALSGVGGDELFGGYPSFAQVPRLVRWLRFAGERPWAGRLARAIAAPLVSRIASPKYAGLFEYGGSYAGAYLLRRALFMPWEVRSVLDPSTVHTGLEELRTLRELQQRVNGLQRPRSRVVSLELSWYMRNQLLRDADWAGMAHSLEIRVPLVDVAFFRAVAPLIASAQYPTKQDLSAALPAPLPAGMQQRPKSGFVTPVPQWISQASGADDTEHGRGLRDWAMRVLPPQPRTIRILALVTDAFGGSGGIAKFNRDLAAALAAMPECAEVVMIPRVMTSAPEAIPPRVRFLTKALHSKVRFTLATLEQILRGHVDLVIVGHINLAPLGALLARLKRVPSVLFVYGIDAWAPHRNPRVKSNLHQFTSIASISEITTERFTQWSGVEPSKVRYVPPCVDLSSYGAGPKSVDLAERLGLRNRTVLMTLGRLDSEERAKGFDAVIESLPRLATIIPNISYLICGAGSDRARLEQKVDHLGVRDRVVFAGFTPEEEKADYYRLADAYVMPSRGEGFGIVFLEALACGIPALGSRMDGGREALLNGALGCLVDPADRDELEQGILNTLRENRGSIPAELAFYSHEMFVQRTSALVRDVLADWSAPKRQPTLSSAGADAK